jgi:hypothetical protein
MAKKKDKLDKVTMVKDMSRANIGPIPPTKVVPQKKRQDNAKRNKRVDTSEMGD